ncbi:unnamed protein product, partial [Phaeothamnion confervicola]
DGSAATAIAPAARGRLPSDWTDSPSEASPSREAGLSRSWADAAVVAGLTDAVASMKAAPGDAGLQERGLRIVAGTPPASDRALRGLVAMGIVDIVVSAFAIHPTEPGVTVAAADTIVALCRSGMRARERLGSSGACKAIVRAMLRLNSNSWVQQACCMAVAALFRAPPQTTRAVAAL